MKAEKMVTILMTSDCRGGVHGLYPMAFNKGSAYSVDLPLAKILTGKTMEVAVYSNIPDNGVFHLNIGPGGNSWKLGVKEKE